MEVNVGEATSWYVLNLSFLRYRSLVIKKNALLKDLKSSIQANTGNLISSSMSNYKDTPKELLPQGFSVLDNQPLGNSNGTKISATITQPNLFCGC